MTTSAWRARQKRKTKARSAPIANYLRPFGPRHRLPVPIKHGLVAEISFTMPKKHVPLLPAIGVQPPSEAGTSPSIPDESLKRKRIGTQVACNNCRLKKSRVCSLVLPILISPEVANTLSAVRWTAAGLWPLFETVHGVCVHGQARCR
jgi:hypothetical protein